MGWLLRVATALPFTGIGLVSLVHCGNDAVGVEACRRIEQRRCALALGCLRDPDSGSGEPFFRLVQNEDDVVQCQAFYEDQCRFGLANDSLGGEPEPLLVDACLGALDAAATCQNESLETCATADTIDTSAATSTRGCSLIFRPEQLTACSFLIPPAEVVVTSAGGGDTTDAEGGGGS
ncbi:MAG: hypothetical protein AAGA56_11610 [Myxococcota bacterium]